MKRDMKRHLSLPTQNQPFVIPAQAGIQGCILNLAAGMNADGFPPARE
jgi:hypothetical protein